MFCDNWNRRFSHKEVGCFNGDGYISIYIYYKSYYTHRLAFLYMEGYLPENEIDHKDNNKINNKWNNLREVSHRCNLQNRNLLKNNTSGVNGIHWDKRSNRWVSRVMVNSKSKYIGSFDNFDEAVWARYNEEVNNPEWSCSVDSSAFKYLKEKGLWEK